MYVHLIEQPISNLEHIYKNDIIHGSDFQVCLFAHVLPISPVLNHAVVSELPRIHTELEVL
jgi:hypothetical protein